MTFWGGSGSADPCLWLMDPDPAIFVIDLQDASQKLIFNKIFSAYYFLKVFLHHFSKTKSQKESQNSRNQGFSYYFCMMIEGSGSGRPKNMWIRWNRIRIRIRNTAWSWMNSLTLMCCRRALGSWYMAAARLKKRPSLPFESGSVKNWALQWKFLLWINKKWFKILLL